MAKRNDGKSKLTEERRLQLPVIAAEIRKILYGTEGFAKWGTSFGEIESDASEIGHEIIRQVMEQVSEEQSRSMPASAMTMESGEVAQFVGTESRVIETPSGPVSWPEPKAFLPESRKDFFPSNSRDGIDGQGRSFARVGAENHSVGE